jgi:hypothetical protein
VLGPHGCHNYRWDTTPVAVGFNLKSAAVYRTLRRGIQPMKSKLLQKISYGVSQSREVVNGQQKSTEDSSVPWRERENPPGRVSPATAVQDHKDSPGLLKHA